MGWWLNRVGGKAQEKKKTECFEKQMRKHAHTKQNNKYIVLV